MSNVVIKFGGSVLSNLDNIGIVAKKIATEFKKPPIIVVSAMSGVTNKIESVIDSVYNSRDLQKDFVFSTGEMFSAGIFSMFLEKFGRKSEPLCGWQVPIETNSSHGNADIKAVHKERISSLLERDIIPVVAGFQGICDGRITTLGRGGTDLSAVSLAVEFGFECCLYKDVSGIFEVDPSIIKSKKLDFISYESMHNASLRGSNVVSHKAVKYASEKNIKVIVKSIFDESECTVISKKEGDSKNLIALQKAFCIKLTGLDIPEIENSIISFNKKWCIFLSESDYLKNKNNFMIEKMYKVNLMHEKPINIGIFIRIAKKYSEMYGNMDTYSWICVSKDKRKELTRELYECFAV
ncbi:hypothetical protein [Candidatus Nesciobacter abundans]|nr:hypothetical protein [Candidatus Nesciobacter abundans]